jgi:hypothetical protein
MGKGCGEKGSQGLEERSGQDGEVTAGEGWGVEGKGRTGTSRDGNKMQMEWTLRDGKSRKGTGEKVTANKRGRDGSSRE